MAWAVLLAVLMSGCKQAGDSGPSGSALGVLEAPPIRVADDNQGLAFRYFDATAGKMATVSAVADVPEEVRAAVMVIDTNAEAAPGNVIYVADLTKKKADGTYGYRVVDRFAYEQARAPRAPAGAPAATVTIYSAEWCGACKQAKAWMTSNRIAFQERDVEKDPRALDDLRADAQRAGVPYSALARKVPVIVVGDKVMPGFDPGAIQAALGK
jgi:glutaredoxin